MPNFLLVPHTFLFTDRYFFFKVSEIESLKGQNRPIRNRRKPAKLIEVLSSDDEDKGKNRPVCKRKKPAQNQPVRKRIKTDKLIDEASLVSLISDDEDSNFAAPELNPIGNSNNISCFDFLYFDLA